MTEMALNDAPGTQEADVAFGHGLRGYCSCQENCQALFLKDAFISFRSNQQCTLGRWIFQITSKDLSSILVSVIWVSPDLWDCTLVCLCLLLLLYPCNSFPEPSHWLFPHWHWGWARGDVPRDANRLRGVSRKHTSRIGTGSVYLRPTPLTLTLSVLVGCFVLLSIYITEDEIVLNNIAFITLTFAQPLFMLFNMSSLHSKWL